MLTYFQLCAEDYQASDPPQGKPLPRASCLQYFSRARSPYPYREHSPPCPCACPLPRPAQWWWRSFLVPAASGVYLYAYCVYFFFAALTIDEGVPQLLYFSYMGLIALFFSFVTGTAGYLASFYFVRAIYGAVRVD